MKKLLSILLLFVSFGALAQTYDTLPAGSKPYGNFYLGPDGNLVFGNVGLKYRVLGTKKRVDSLLDLRVPYTGATSSLNLGSYDLSANHITTGIGGISMANNVEITPSLSRVDNLRINQLFDTVDRHIGVSTNGTVKLMPTPAPISGSPNYIQNNNTGTPQSASFNINGIGRFDSPTATTLLSAGLGSFSNESGATTINGGNVNVTGLLTADNQLNYISGVVFDRGSPAMIDLRLTYATDGNWLGMRADGDSKRISFGKFPFGSSEGSIHMTGNDITDGFGNTFLKSGDIPDLTPYQLKSEKGQVNGYASLGADGKIPNAQVPSLAISETFPVASQAAMLALSTAEQGDVAIRSDISKSFILSQSPASTLANWMELLTPTDAVSSVNGMVGNVTIDDVPKWNGINVDWSDGSIPVINTVITMSPTGLVGRSNPSHLKTFLGVNENTSSSTIVQRTSGGDINANNFLGNSTSTTIWGGNDANFSSYGTGTINWLIGAGNSVSTVKPWAPPEIRDFLGMPTGGETLQSVTDRSNTTTNTIISDGDLRARDLGNDNSIVFTSSNTYPSIQGANYANSAVKHININPFGGNLGVGMSTAATEALDVNGNGKFSGLSGSSDRSVVADATGKLKTATAVPNSTGWNGQTLGLTSLTSGDFIKYNGTNFINSKIYQSDFANPTGTLTRLAGFNGSSSAMHYSANDVTAFLASSLDANYIKTQGNAAASTLNIGTTSVQDVNIIRNSVVSANFGVTGMTTAFPIRVTATNDGNANTVVKNADLTALASSGTYTPTLTGVLNVNSSTAVLCHYTRVGNEVTVTGRFIADPTSTGTIQVGISLPIASALTAAEDASGFGSAGSTQAAMIPISTYYRTASSAVVVEGITTSTGSLSYRFQFTYTIK